MRFVVPALAALLTACGQTGALYLPDEGVETPVEIRGPATPAEQPQAPTPQPTPEQPPVSPPETPPEEEKNGEKKPAAPAGG